MIRCATKALVIRINTTGKLPLCHAFAQGDTQYLLRSSRCEPFSPWVFQHFFAGISPYNYGRDVCSIFLFG